ncbi:hypothetical protein [uncultured Alistipes sp.]|uniref:hypothetical protein n=1 Tax=uncultured Alistipes sp. TaxID=538949 RepID=UPI00266C63DF|nr:hypothetical protein [uncultured Alistipes sp.]
MSALSFKINAETDKLNSFIASLKRLKEVLADIPSGTKEFDVINRKIAEMEVRVEQTMKRIAQMQNEASKTVSQPTAASPAAPSSAGSAAGVQAVNAETEAWRGLLEELHAVSLAKRENIELIERLKAENRSLKAQYDALNKAERDGFTLTDKQIARRTSLSLAYEENKQAISRMRQEVANQIKLEQVAEGSMDEMSQALSRMRIVYRSLNKEERESTLGQNLLKNIQTLDTKIKELDASIGNHQRNVGNYASSWNGLSVSIQQVAREIPSFTYGIQTGFMAISNNMPILFDEIIRARKAVEALKKAGESYVPVWRQIARSIISWQTLLVAGITVLTLYGKEITGWVGSLFKGKKAVDAAKVATEQFHETLSGGNIDAQGEIVKLEQLYKAATDLSNTQKERAEAVKKLQDLYPAYFSNMSNEQIMLGDAITAYNDLRDAIIRTAEAKAAEERIKENAGYRIILSEAKAWERYSAALHEIEPLTLRYADAQRRMKEYKGTSIFSQAAREAQQIEQIYNVLEKKLSTLQDEIFDDLKKTKRGDELVEIIEEVYNGNLQAFIQSMDAMDEKLARAAKPLYTTQSPEERNKEYEATQKEQEKAASEQEKSIKNLEKKLQQLRDEALQAEINSMKEGSAKIIAQINFDYKKREQAITNAENELRKKQGGTLNPEQQKWVSSARSTYLSQYILAISSAIGTQMNKERQAQNEYLAEYGDYQQKRLAITELYAAKIAQAETSWEKKSAEAERNKALKELDLSMLKKTTLWTRLFKDSETMATASIKKIIADTESLLQYIDEAKNGNGDETILAALGLTKEQVDAVAAEPEKLKPILDALKGKIDALNKRDPFGQLIKGFKDLTEAGEDADKQTEAVNKIISGFKGASTLIGDIGDTMSELGEAIGSDFVAGFGESLNLLSDTINNAVSGAQSGMAIGGPAGAAVGAGIGIVTSLFSAASAAAKRHHEALTAIKNAEIAQQREYNLLLLEQNLEYEKGTTIFGTDQYAKAANAVDVYKQSVQSLENALSDVANIDIVTGHKKTGLFGWGKGKDLYSDILKVYPELISSNGEFNRELAETILNTRKMSEANKNALQNAIDLYDQMEDALASVSDYLSGIFGDLGNTITDALVNAAESGTDAFAALSDSVGDMIRTLAKQMIYSVTIAPLAEKAQNDMLEWAKKEDISETERTKGMIGVLKNLVNDAVAQQGQVNELLEAVNQAAQENGFDISETPTQSGTARGYQVASQDEVAEQNGRLTDIQGKLSDIRAYVMDETISIISVISSVADIRNASIQNVQINNDLLQYAVRTYIEVAEINSSTKNIDKRLARVEDGINRIAEKL